MTMEIFTISNQIREKLDYFYAKGGEFKVFTDGDTIIIKGNTSGLSETYTSFVSGEISLSLEDAKKFYESLNEAIIINNYLNKSAISFRVTNGNRIVFAYEGKEISGSDIFSLYRKLENQELGNSLQLSLNMIKVKSLYEYYIDLIEQVEKKHAFLDSYNDLITSLDGKKEAIRFAKQNKGTWLKIRSHVPSRKFDITIGEDIVDTIINGENISFNDNGITLEQKNKYLYNLSNYELRINNLIERLEKEIQILKSYNEEASKLLEKISACNILNIKPLSAIPEYRCLSMEVILDEEKRKYTSEVAERDKIQETAKTIDEKYPWLQDIDKQQRTNLDTSEKTALMLYKSFMYHLFNKIISYSRDNNTMIEELYNDEYIEKLIMEEYEKYVARQKGPKVVVSNSVKTVVNDIFPDNIIVEYNRFRQIVLDNVVLLENALKKNILTKPLTVYRCVYEPSDAQIYSGNLGNALLSTSVDKSFVSDFMRNREQDIEFASQKVIYKIELPEGSPVVAYTNDVFLNDGTPKVGFGEDQQEILIDSKAYDFEYVNSDFYNLSDGTTIYTVTLNAVPKKEKIFTRH